MALQIVSRFEETPVAFQTSRSLIHLEGHSGHVTSLSVSPQGLLASSCTEGTVQLWSVLQPDEPSCHATLSVGCGASAAAFCDNWIGVSAGDGRLHLFDIISGSHRKIQPSRSDINILNDVVWSDDMLVFGGDSGRVFFCDPRSRQIAREVQCGPPITALAAEGQRWFCGLADGTVREIDNRGNTNVLYTHSGIVSGLCATEGVLSSRDSKGALTMWNTKPFVTESRLIRENTQTEPFTCPLLARLSVSPSGLFIGHGNGSCEHVDLSGDRRWIRQDIHDGAVTKVIAIGDGFVASSGWDGRVTIFST